VSFGDDPFIVALDSADDNAKFSAWSYAKEHSRVICGESDRTPCVQLSASLILKRPRPACGESVGARGRIERRWRAVPSSVGFADIFSRSREKGRAAGVEWGRWSGT
jgi:hypothetical protein